MASTNLHPVLKTRLANRVKLSCRIATRASTTFFTLDVVDGCTPVPGLYTGVVEVGASRAPCALRVVDRHELWCQPRGPLAPTREGIFVRVHVVPSDDVSIGCPSV